MYVYIYIYIYIYKGPQRALGGESLDATPPALHLGPQITPKPGKSLEHLGIRPEPILASKGRKSLRTEGGYRISRPGVLTYCVNLA